MLNGKGKTTNKKDGTWMWKNLVTESNALYVPHVIQRVNGGTEAPVQAKDAIVDEGSKGEVIEEVGK
jgi:hypothetical protein